MGEEHLQGSLGLATDSFHKIPFVTPTCCCP